MQGNLISRLRRIKEKMMRSGARGKSMVSDPILFVYEAISNLDQHTAEQFALTVNRLKGKITILFITHQLPKGLLVDESVILGKNDTNLALKI